ncbi:four-helix bundle copper-binding protein [Sinomonas halotolerans]|uniref:Four-helix bundle copper-binding protein n=1 Tax=Sinomonas halotolerans TaxID=1644133 RepID=A0ABU9X1W6_9MICC
MTHQIEDMIGAHPERGGTPGLDREKLAACIRACFESAQACTACADACLAEDAVAELARCVRIDLDCADVCSATGNLLSRHSGEDLRMVRIAVEACRIACASCAVECEQHADHHEHCRLCAEACRRCERACAELLASMG